MTGSLTLSQGRRSPVGAFMEQRSPQGRRSPIFLTHDRLRSPNELPVGYFDQKSPTIEKRSPTDRRSPTFSVHTQDRLSPIGMIESQRRSPTSTVHVQDGHSYDQDHTPDEPARTPTGLLPIKRTSISLFTPIPFGDKRSPITTIPIPPITVSNPSETCKIVEKTMAEAKSPLETSKELEKLPEIEKDNEEKKEKETKEEKKEKTSVMKEILAFVRKPSKRVTTRTGRFAAAFSRAESGSSGGPLLRQSTFSASPAAASTAAKSAVTKQMSEIGFESKMSLKFSLSNTKMSLKLRRSAADDKNKKEKKSNIDEAAAINAPPSTIMEIDSKSPTLPTATVVSSNDQEVGKEALFELANVHFEKVGDSYIKHEQIKEEPSEEGSPIQIVASSNENAQKITESIIEECTITDTVNDTDTDKIDKEKDNTPTKTPEQMFDIKQDFTDPKTLPVKPEPIYQNLLELRASTEEKLSQISMPLQCPTFEIEPPSRRSSFDPPRSPYLENLRSPGGETDPELMNLNRGDSGGDSFEIVDGDRNRESSFEDRYSSRDTSFDISRYQSTSYEDQTSSFEIVDIDRNEDKKSNIDLRKSSIELVDADTFARSGSSGRKSSLETHFDYTPQDCATPKNSFPTTTTTTTTAKKHKSSRDFHILQYISRARSPLSNQTSSNYSSRDSYDSSSSYPHSHYTSTEQKSPFADPSKQHFPLTLKCQSEEVRTFLCTDPKCASIFEPRTSSASSTSSRALPPAILSGLSQCTLSGNEFEPPSPRRAASASPKHTFTFRIVLKKVDSSPDAICPSAERRSRERYEKNKRRDSRKKRLHDAGKSF